MAALVLGWAVFDLLVMVVALRPWRGPDARRPAPWIAALVFLAWVLIDGGRTYAYLIAQGSWTAATILIPYVGVKGLVFGFLAYAAAHWVRRGAAARGIPGLKRWSAGIAASAALLVLLGADISTTIKASYIRAAGDKDLDAAGVARVVARIETNAAAPEEVHAFLSNAKCPPALLERHATGTREDRMAVARNPALAPDLAVQLARDTDKDVRMYAAYNPNMPADEFPRLSRDDNHYVREAMAWRKALPDEDFARLVIDPESRVRAAAALQPRIATEDLRRLSADSDDLVRHGAARKLAERGE